MANKPETGNPIEELNSTVPGAPGAGAEPAGEVRRPPRKFGPRGGQAPRGNRFTADDDGGRGPGGGRRGGYFQGRRKVCPIKIEEVDWKNLDSLRYFVSESGNIRSRRKTGATAKLQRRVAVAVKRARHMALLPYTSEHVRITGRR